MRHTGAMIVAGSPGTRTLLLLVGVLAILTGGSMRAQQTPIEVDPNRPTFARPARTTQAGALEAEWGGPWLDQGD